MKRNTIYFTFIILFIFCFICLAGEAANYVYSMDQMSCGAGRSVYSSTCNGTMKKNISYVGEEGHVMYGPYVNLPVGPKLVFFKNINSETSSGATVDILNWPAVANQQQIFQPGQSITIPLSFQVDNQNDEWEFRLYSNGAGTVSVEDKSFLTTSYPGHPSVCATTYPVYIYEGNQIQFEPGNELANPQDAGILYKYRSNQMSSSTGTVDAEGCRFANSADHSAGHLCYGPYVNNPFYGGEQYYVTFELSSIKDDNLPNDLVARIDVTSNSGSQILAAKDIRRSDFHNYSGKKEAFTLAIPSNEYIGLEFRVYFYDSNNTYVKVHDVWMFSTGAIPVGTN